MSRREILAVLAAAGAWPRAAWAQRSGGPVIGFLGAETPNEFEVRRHAFLQGLGETGTAGRVLRGEKPSELPMQRSTTTELIVNLKSARSLGIDRAADDPRARRRGDRMRRRRGAARAGPKSGPTHANVET